MKIGDKVTQDNDTTEWATVMKVVYLYEGDHGAQWAECEWLGLVPRRFCRDHFLVSRLVVVESATLVDAAE